MCLCSSLLFNFFFLLYMRVCLSCLSLSFFLLPHFFLSLSLSLSLARSLSLLSSLFVFYCYSIFLFLFLRFLSLLVLFRSFFFYFSFLYSVPKFEIDSADFEAWREQYENDLACDFIYFRKLQAINKTVIEYVCARGKPQALKKRKLKHAGKNVYII